MTSYSIYNSRNLIGVFGPTTARRSSHIYNSRNLIGVFGHKAKMKAIVSTTVEIL